MPKDKKIMNLGCGPLLLEEAENVDLVEGGEVINIDLVDYLKANQS